MGEVDSVCADGCDLGYQVIRGLCRTPEAPSCGQLGEPCCSTELLFPTGFDGLQPDKFDEGPECTEPNLTCVDNDGVMSIDPTCQSCGRDGERPCKGVVLSLRLGCMLVMCWDPFQRLQYDNANS